MNIHALGRVEYIYYVLIRGCEMGITNENLPEVPRKPSYEFKNWLVGWSQRPLVRLNMFSYRRREGIEREDERQLLREMEFLY